MTKQEKIRKLIEMQKQFIKKEQAHTVTMAQYFSSDSDSDMYKFRHDYVKLAMEIVDEAHDEVGSKR